MRVIRGAHGRTAGFRHAKLYWRFGLRDSGVLIERQRAGLDVYEISGFGRRRPARRSGAGGVGLQIDSDFAFRSDYLGHGIIGKIRAINLVGAVLVASVDNDADVMQRRAAAFFILLHAGSVDGEELIRAVILGECESCRALQDVFGDALLGRWNLALHFPKRVKIESRRDHNN